MQWLIALSAWLPELQNQSSRRTPKLHFWVHAVYDPNDLSQAGEMLDASPDQESPPEASPLVGLPAWITLALIEETQTAWEPIYGHPVTQAEAIEIIQTFNRLVDMLSDTQPT